MNNDSQNVIECSAPSQGSSPVTKTDTNASKKTGPKKRGRKPKAENSSPKPQLNWSVPMTESLLRLRRETHIKYFRSKNNPKAATEGWALVLKDWCLENGMTVPLEKVRSKYDSMLKKWRDHGPTGKESKKTGNFKPDPEKDDPIIPIITPYFAKSPGTGSDLGQSSDQVPDDVDGPNDDPSDLQDSAAPPSPPAPPAKKPKLQPPSQLGDQLETGFSMISDGMRDLASAVSGQTTNEMKSFVQESRAAFASLKDSIDNSTRIQMAMLEVLQKISGGSTSL